MQFFIINCRLSIYFVALCAIPAYFFLLMLSLFDPCSSFVLGAFARKVGSARSKYKVCSPCSIQCIPTDVYVMPSFGGVACLKSTIVAKSPWGTYEKL